MGTSIQFLSEQVCLLASKNSWIEGQAIQQLHNTAGLPGMFRVAGMPDLHPGKGYPIGAACLSQGQLYPALVGSDIGCGMALWQSDVIVRKAKPDSWAQALTGVESPLNASWQQAIHDEKQQRHIQQQGFDSALGTMGGGNHFAEFQQVDEIFDRARFDACGLDKQRIQLLVHSGSRGLGQQILQQHVQQFGHAGLSDGSSEQQAYLQQHDDALRWAELNRELIARRFLQAIKTEGRPLLDVNHNLVSQVTDTQPGWLHRKGATPSDQGLVVIPGSRGDYSWLVEPIADASHASTTLWSLAHGAGRKWKRSDCKGRKEPLDDSAQLCASAAGFQNKAAMAGNGQSFSTLPTKL